MGIIKNKNGVLHAQLKVPRRLRVAVARVLGHGKAEQAYLKKSLGTKEPKVAKLRAKLVLSEFDQVIEQAYALMEVDATPKQQRSGPETVLNPQGCTIREAAFCWRAQRTRNTSSAREALGSVELFVQLHGDLPVIQIKRSHVRTFREALQFVPRRRDGVLSKALLPELKAWGEAHPRIEKISPATINKQLRAVQAIASWAYANGLLPEYAPWTDPFSRMRVKAEQPERAQFTPGQLQALFNAPLFTRGGVPAGAGGAAGVWLPLLALFTGARRAELARLTAGDVVVEASTPVLLITEQLKVGKQLKTKGSQRAIPVHPHLIALGFLEYTATRRRDGATAWLFPTIAPDQKRALATWSKWFGRYLRNTVGIINRTNVFQALRNSFKEAAREAKMPQEICYALTGYANVAVFKNSNGAKQRLHHFSIDVLRDAVVSIDYRGLDLSKVCIRQLVSFDRKLQDGGTVFRN